MHPFNTEHANNRPVTLHVAKYRYRYPSTGTGTQVCLYTVRLSSDRLWWLCRARWAGRRARCNSAYLNGSHGSLSLRPTAVLSSVHSQLVRQQCACHNLLLYNALARKPSRQTDRHRSHLFLAYCTPNYLPFVPFYHV